MSDLAKKAPKKRVIVALGDSITAGGYARHLKDIVPNSRPHTFGYGGKQTGFIMKKLDLALAKKPDDIIILAGVNDIASGRSFEHITGNLKNVIKPIRPEQELLQSRYFHGMRERVVKQGGFDKKG